MDYTLIALVLAFWLIAALGTAFITALKALAVALVAALFDALPNRNRKP
jgi:hypothetical protein